MSLTVRRADPDDPALAPVIDAHLAHCGDLCPSNHVLGRAGLKAITLFAAYDDGAPVGIGALKNLGAGHGEVKSMHTAKAARGKGVARALLAAIIADAKAEDMTRLSLETGTDPDFAAARAFYEEAGFDRCPPFATYKNDPASVFYTCALAATA
ncbi:MAG: GNAT family N-acetyltransferase [Pseudomonadota bacterium]